MVEPQSRFQSVSLGDLLGRRIASRIEDRDGAMIGVLKAALDEEMLRIEPVVALDSKAATTTVPVTYVNDLYHLRRHISLIGNRIQSQMEEL